MKDKLEKALKKIRPMLQADGGDIELVAVEGKRVKLRLRGACAHCPAAQMTLKHGVEKALRAEVPELEGVDAVQ